MAFAATMGGDGHELLFTREGTSATWDEDYIRTKFRHASTIANNGVLNTAEGTQVIFSQAVTLADDAVLTKRGEGLLQFTNTIGGTGSLAIEAGDVALGSNSVIISQMLGGTGTISGTGTLTLDTTAVVSPGNSTGTLTLTDANLVLTDGELFIEIGGVNQGVAVDGYDHLVLTNGTATLTGATLRVELIDDFFPDATDVFTILNAGSVVGEFASLEVAMGGLLLTYDVIYNADSVQLSNLQVIPEPGTMLLLAAGSLLMLGRRRVRR